VYHVTSLAGIVFLYTPPPPPPPPPPCCCSQIWWNVELRCFLR
jgi:hypothetical protein